VGVSDSSGGGVSAGGNPLGWVPALACEGLVGGSLEVTST
jgi:hypothetical protein